MVKIIMSKYIINIERQFSRYPAGRYETDGPYSGEKFREKFLIPALRQGKEKVRIDLDGARGYGSSFLEEAFGGLVRSGYTAEDIFKKFEFNSQDRTLIEEIKGYITDEANSVRGI